MPDQRRADLHDGAVWSGKSGQDMVVPERVEQGPGEGAAGCAVPGVRLASDLDARDQPGPADVAEAGVLPR
jgi:hypothetical protein